MDAKTINRFPIRDYLAGLGIRPAKDRERVNKKTGKVTVIRGSTPIKEGVVVIKENTTMEQLRHFCEVCKERWGITPLQIFIHRDEGHYETPGDETSWKPNYHAHIVWDWMNHDTGKSCKLDKKDMSEMQTLLAECLEMQRGHLKEDNRQRASGTDGLYHCQTETGNRENPDNQGAGRSGTEGGKRRGGNMNRPPKDCKAR